MRNDIILIFGIAISLRATLSKLFNLALTGVYCTILIDFNGHLALMCEEDYRLHKVLYEGGTITVEHIYLIYCILIVTNPIHALPVTHHQRSLAHHMDSCTTLTVAHYLRLYFP